MKEEIKRKFSYKVLNFNTKSQMHFLLFSFFICYNLQVNIYIDINICMIYILELYVKYFRNKLQNLIGDISSNFFFQKFSFWLY